jgi:hypothetical protein
METSGIPRRVKKGAPGPRIHVLVVDDSAVVSRVEALILRQEQADLASVL